MQSYVYAKLVGSKLCFYLSASGEEHFLFTQKNYTTVREYFSGKVLLSKALDFTGTRSNPILNKVIEKLPMYIQFIEKEHGVTVLDKTAKKQQKKQSKLKDKNWFDFDYEYEIT